MFWVCRVPRFLVQSWSGTRRKRPGPPLGVSSCHQDERDDLPPSPPVPRPAMAAVSGCLLERPRVVCRLAVDGWSGVDDPRFGEHYLSLPELVPRDENRRLDRVACRRTLYIRSGEGPLGGGEGGAGRCWSVGTRGVLKGSSLTSRTGRLRPQREVHSPGPP